MDRPGAAEGRRWPLEPVCSAGRLEEGAKVEGNYRGRGKWYPGALDASAPTARLTSTTTTASASLRSGPGAAEGRRRLSSPFGSATSGGGRQGGGQLPWPRQVVPGVIGRERANGTFDINYDDGERELGVDRDLVRLKDDGGHSSPSRSAGRLEEGAKVRATTVAAASGTPV